MNCLSAKEIVTKLDRNIIGQEDAKKAVAIALRNRYRRSQLDEEIRNEITPKNIIMAGPTGVGKTEIARRLAKLTKSPFIKVEATKFTEVGYVGRDVDSIVRDLVEASIRMVKDEMYENVKMQAQNNAHEILIDLLMPQAKKKPEQKNEFQSALAMLLPTSNEKEESLTDEEKQEKLSKRQQIAKQLNEGLLEDNIVEVEVEAPQVMALDVMGGVGAEINIGDMFSGVMPKKTKTRKVKVSDARTILEQEEANKLIDMDEVTQEAIKRAEQQGIVFLDEIDKIAGKGSRGPDVSREGVQRDILPLVEGCTVMTKYGPIKTDFILFIAAGAFHVAKFNDLIPELQGRFPIKVNLKPLTKDDMICILSKTDNAIIKQYQCLLKVDNIDIKFTEDALEEIGEYAITVNEENENIGARRLHTIIENLLEDVSFNASGEHPMLEVVIDKQYVNNHLKEDYKKHNIKNGIL